MGTWGVGFGFATHGEEVAFVGNGDGAIGMGKDETVAEGVLMGKKDGCGNVGLGLTGHGDEPIERLLAEGGMGGGGCGNEACGEHFGEDVELGMGLAADEVGGLGEVLVEGGLEEGE